MEIATVQKNRQCLLHQCFNASSVLSLNMAIGICLKIDPSGLQQKCFSGDFPLLLELRLLKTHISGCFQSAREAAVCRIFIKYLGRQRDGVLLQRSFAKTQRILIFQNVICVSLFGLI